MRQHPQNGTSPIGGNQHHADPTETDEVLHLQQRAPDCVLGTTENDENTGTEAEETAENKENLSSVTNVTPASPKRNTGGRIIVPEGETVESMIRKGMEMERGSGLPRSVHTGRVDAMAKLATIELLRTIGLTVT